MRIQDVEIQTGLDRATIRFYEKEGILNPQRSENGYRQYSDEDVQLLLKIKLLRQLDVTLLKIKAIQKGSMSFSDVLIQQIAILEERIQQDTKAKYICSQMQLAGVSFSGLDAQFYLNMFENYPGQLSKPFEESIRKEAHPWRRHIARMIDYAWIQMLILLILIVVIRIRPFQSNAINLIGFASGFIAVPIIALMLHAWGTTPGKWVMGIRVEDANGGKLSINDALWREGKLISSGVGYFIPIYAYWRMYRSYREESEGERNSWNEDCEIIYIDWSAARKTAMAAIMIVCAIINAIISIDAIFPKYRRNNLTVAQFAENHFDYEKMLNARSEYYLGPDGTWKEANNDSTLYLTIDSIGHTRTEFQYTLNDNAIQAITYSDCWESDGFLSTLPSYCDAAMNAFIGARPGTTIFELMQIDEIDQIMEEQINEAIVSGTAAGGITISDVKVSWDITLSGCDLCGKGMLFSNEDEIISYSLDFKMEILE